MIKKQTLENGLTLVSEALPHVRSVAIGVWLKRGSRHEQAAQSGISHFIEHMVFKGTANRSAEQIAREVDSIGGHMDAFTAKEYAAFHLKVLDQHLPLAVELLGDIVRNPRFDPAEISKEKQVVFEEMAMVEDTPDDLVMELFQQAFWPEHALGRPILGTRDTVERFERAELLSFFRRAYHPGNLVIAAAGRLQHAELARLVRRAFAGLERGARPRGTRPPLAQAAIVRRSKRELEQVHLCLGASAPHQTHPDRFAAYLLDTVLGGSMSSRLFQNVREKRGLCYSISSGMSSYSDSGMLTVYAGTRKDSLDELLRLSVLELRRLRDEPVPEDELRRAKDHLKGGLLLSLESTGSRMNFLARQEIYFGRQADLDRVLEDIESVSARDVRRVARRMFSGELALSVLGNLGSYRPKRSQLRV